MLREQHILCVLTVNLFFCAAWHIVVFILCVNINTCFFSPDRRLYRPHKWERDGRFYSSFLKINKWKDLLPQHTGKNGFSKEHFEGVSLEYIDMFIMETCRGEWNHTMNCVLTVFLFALNDLLTAAVFSLLVIAGNLPFMIIQRYNRLRLQRVRNCILRKTGKKELRKKIKERSF